MINNKNVTNIELPRMGDVDLGNPRKIYSRCGLCPPTRSQKRPSNRPPAGAFYYFTAKAQGPELGPTVHCASAYPLHRPHRVDIGTCRSSCSRNNVRPGSDRCLM